MNRSRFKVVQPAQFKVEVIIGSLPGGRTMDDISFRCTFSSGGKSIELDNSEFHKISTPLGNRYIAPLSSDQLGKGDVMMTVTADIPDSAFSSGHRKDVDICDTLVTIV